MLKPEERLSGEYQKVLQALFDLMLTCGLRRKAIEGLVTTALEKAHSLAPPSTKDLGGLKLAGLVLDAWHRDKRYLSADASPQAVRLLGAPPSVEALIRAQGVSRHARRVAQNMRKLRLLSPISRRRYLPVSDAAVISARNPLVMQHAALALETLLATVGNNVSADRLAPLIERVAEVPDLPTKYITEFQKFTQSQGKVFLSTVNDWLEARRMKQRGSKKTKRTVRAGVHTYAYVTLPSRKVWLC